MKLLTRPIIAVIAVTAGAILLSAAIVAATALAAPPVGISVHVKEEGIKFWIPVPSLWLESGVAMIPLEGLPLDDIPEEGRQALKAAAGIVHELGKIDDATLVEVETDEETVLITKRGKRFRVEVRSPEADVDIEMPISTLESLVRSMTA